jgi:hypothetical protein
MRNERLLQSMGDCSGGKYVRFVAVAVLWLNCFSSGLELLAANDLAHSHSILLHQSYSQFTIEKSFINSNIDQLLYVPEETSHLEISLHSVSLAQPCFFALEQDPESLCTF